MGTKISARTAATAPTGAETIGVIQGGLDRRTVLGMGSVMTPEHYGCVGDGVTDDTTNFQACLTAGHPAVFAKNRYLITSTLSLADHQVLFGLPVAADIDESLGALNPRIIFNPGVDTKVCIKNAAGTSGNGVQDLTIVMNNSTHTAIQFSASYGNFAKRIQFSGTMNIGLLSDDTYVCQYHDLSFQGSTLKTAALYIDDCNGMSIERLFTESIALADANVCCYGIAIQNGHANAIRDCVLQGNITIGIATNAGSFVIENMYNEEVLVNCRFGNINGGTPSSQGQITVIGGMFGQANSGHTQYASRGPNIIAAMSTLQLTNPSFLGTANTASGGVWPILLYGAGPITLNGGYHYESPIVPPNLHKLFVQKNGAATQAYTILGEQYGDHAGTRIVLKDTGAYGSGGHALTVDNSGTFSSATAVTPATAGAAVASLLTTDLVAGSTLVIA